MTATTNAPASPERLEFCQFRDDFARVYNPANSVEQMFVAQIAMTWQRLTRAQDAEQRFFASNDILEAMAKKPKEYKAVVRYVSECERAWRHAVQHLERMQRQRRRSDLSPANARRSNPASAPVQSNGITASARNLSDTQPAASRAG